MKILSVAIFLAVPALAQHINAGCTVDTNCGPSGNYGADQYFNGGQAYTATVTLPVGLPDYLRTSRGGVFNGIMGSTFAYQFTVAPGVYSVSLHFVENSSAITAASQRVFSVTINGDTVLPALDIYKEVGRNVELVKQFGITVKPGSGIGIVFSALLRNAVVSAIDIMPVAAPPAAPFPGCASDGMGGISCTGSVTTGAEGKYDAAITFNGITYRWPKDDGTGKLIGDSGPSDCGNMDPLFLAKLPVCHQLVWK